MARWLVLLLLALGSGGCDSGGTGGASPEPASERHLAGIRQLTFGGENAEAYFSSDGRELVFQSPREGIQCDAIFRMGIDGKNVQMVSSSKGRTPKR